MLGKRKKKKTLPALCAVIVAAGSSRRMGGENKLLLPLAGAPVLAHTLSAFEKCAAVRDIVLVCREQDILPYTELAQSFGISKLRTVTRGGDTRTASVLAGVQAAPGDTVLVAVHDGARPLVSEAVITEAAYAVQTPQVFDRTLLLRALETAAQQGRSFTDDCAAVEALGQAVQATHGSYENLKITTPEDILVAQALLQKEDD